MHEQPDSITFHLPDWLKDFANRYELTPSLSERMRFVVSASKMNIEKGTGGPFSAGVFESESGKLISIGVNLVTSEMQSILHAEMVAIALAQKKLGTYDLGSKAMPSHQLVISSEPCVMCFGAILWSGIFHVVTAASDKDARDIGFDEGPKPINWINELQKRGIQVTTNIDRGLAQKVLHNYVESGGHIYNSRESLLGNQN